MVDRSTAFLISLVTSLFVAIGVNFAFYYWIEPNLERKKTFAIEEKVSEKVEVPDLRGSLPSQAKLVLSQMGLSLVVEGEIEQAEYPEGTIAEQRPLPGSVLPSGTSIYVKIVKGKKEEKSISVPPVMGLDLASAQRILIEKGFLIGNIERVFASNVPEGHVVKTYPEAGSPLPKGSKITIYVSSGEELVTVPRLIGKYLYQANSILEKAGLKLGTVYREVSAEYPENKIISQNPPPGANVKKGTTVDITIATVREELY